MINSSAEAASEFFGRWPCKSRRFTGGKSRDLQETRLKSFKGFKSGLCPDRGVKNNDFDATPTTGKGTAESVRELISGYLGTALKWMAFLPV